MSSTPVQHLLNELDRQLEADPKGPGVASLLEAYSNEHDDWRRFAHFSSECYTRNLVRSSVLYELIVLCWEEGQVTPIHDHQGMRCWMSVLDGHLQETLFDVPAAAGPMSPRSAKTLAQGQVAYITDDIALHEIRPVGGGGVSLHLYSSPIPSCRIYDPSTGAFEDRQLTYHSVGGELQGART